MSGLFASSAEALLLQSPYQIRALHHPSSRFVFFPTSSTLSPVGGRLQIYQSQMSSSTLCHPMNQVLRINRHVCPKSWKRKNVFIFSQKMTYASVRKEHHLFLFGKEPVFFFSKPNSHRNLSGRGTSLGKKRSRLSPFA